MQKPLVTALLMCSLNMEIIEVKFGVAHIFCEHEPDFVHAYIQHPILVSPFHMPRKPLGRVKVQLYSILDLCTRRG